VNVVAVFAISLKPVKDILNRGKGERGRGRIMEGMNQTRYIVSIHGCHNEPLYNDYILIKTIKKS
jgi:hypothetical protein